MLAAAGRCASTCLAGPSLLDALFSCCLLESTIGDTERLLGRARVLGLGPAVETTRCRSPRDGNGTGQPCTGAGSPASSPHAWSRDGARSSSVGEGSASGPEVSAAPWAVPGPRSQSRGAGGAEGQLCSRRKSGGTRANVTSAPFSAIRVLLASPSRGTVTSSRGREQGMQGDGSASGPAESFDTQGRGEASAPQRPNAGSLDFSDTLATIPMGETERELGRTGVYSPPSDEALLRACSRPGRAASSRACTRADATSSSPASSPPSTVLVWSGLHSSAEKGG
mmetsp:Transcript_6225/g.18489  ORF Transcript_6225/g.18489 Transcript_6225/m.18489 type:complete len:282 (+) Transcript_6225:763-1608(+)